MNEQLPQPSRANRTKKYLRRMGALAGVTGAAMFSGTTLAHAAGNQEHLSTNDSPNTYMTQDALPMPENVLLEKIRSGEIKAALLNGAIDFHSPTQLYMSPADKKHRVVSDSNKPFKNEPMTSDLAPYYTMLVRMYGTVWAGTLDTLHQSGPTSGQGSDAARISWIPISEMNPNGYTIYRNTADGAGDLLPFHEIPDTANPSSFDIVANGSNPQLPNTGAIMSMGAWSHAETVSNLHAAGLKPISSKAAKKLLANVR